MGERKTFENFCPRLIAGRVIPLGKRLLFENESGDRQIILPIEMADVIVLSNGQYSMRQIVDKVYQRRGHLHFKTLFRSIHHLRDYGFFINGNELESHGLWQPQDFKEDPFTFQISIWGKRIVMLPKPKIFYFVSLAFVAMAMASIAWFPKPLFRGFSAIGHGHFWLVPVLAYIIVSVLKSCQSLVKIASQLLLTGNIFGLTLHLSWRGFYLKTQDEPIFLINNRLYLTLYHLAIVASPCLFILPLNWWRPDLFDFAAIMVIVNSFSDFSPYGQSELMNLVRSILSLGQSDLVAGYLKENSLLSLLEPLGRPRTAVRLRQWFTLYLWVWTTILGVASLALISGLPFYGDSKWAQHLVTGLAGMTIAYFGLWPLMKHTHRTSWPRWKAKLAAYTHRARSWQRNPWNEEQIRDAFSRLPLFSYFSSTLMSRVVNLSELITLKPGEQIIQQGEVGKDLFILLSGSLLVERVVNEEKRETMSTLKPTSVFGEMAIVEENQRSADVHARESSTVLKIPIQALKAAARESQYIRELEAFRNAIVINQFFTSAPLFRELGEETAHELMTRSTLRYQAPGDIIVRQGDIGRSFYMIVRGEVRIVIDGHEIKRLRQGAFFGEISLIADIPRTASVYATAPTMVLELAASNFWEILCQNIELALFVEAVAEARIQEDLLVATIREKHQAS